MAFNFFGLNFQAERCKVPVSPLCGSTVSSSSHCWRLSAPPPTGYPSKSQAAPGQAPQHPLCPEVGAFVLNNTIPPTCTLKTSSPSFMPSHTPSVFTFPRLLQKRLPAIGLFDSGFAGLSEPPRIVFLPLSAQTAPLLRGASQSPVLPKPAGNREGFLPDLVTPLLRKTHSARSGVLLQKQGGN